MASEQYSNAAVYVRGALLLEATGITVTRRTNAQPQVTLAKGFAGMSPGAPTMEIQVTNALPAVGIEYDPGEIMQLLSTESITVFAGNGSLTATGFITEDSFKKAVNSEATLDFTMMCGFEQWQ
jgi:hypothetical protein